MKLFAIILITAMLFSLTACRQVTQTAEQVKSTDTISTEVSSEITEIDTLYKDTDFSDMDTLDEDLSEVDW